MGCDEDGHRLVMVSSEGGWSANGMTCLTVLADEAGTNCAHSIERIAALGKLKLHPKCALATAS
jgi:hypothetical protein